MKKTVYAVTAGEYSDYHVKELFTTRELAEQHIARIKGDGWDKPEVQEWNLWDEPMPGARFVHLFGDWQGDGSYLPAGSRTTEDEFDRVVEDEESLRATPALTGGGYGDSHYHKVHLTVEGTDLERCRKVFSDTWAQILAFPEVWQAKGHFKL